MVLGAAGSVKGVVLLERTEQCATKAQKREARREEQSLPWAVAMSAVSPLQLPNIALIMASLLNGMNLLGVKPEDKYIARGVVLARAVSLDMKPAK